MTISSNPKLLICATPAYGHVMPLRAIARLLISRGYDVTFLTGSDFKQAIEEIGATFIALQGQADVTKEKLPQIIEESINADPLLTQDNLIRRLFIEVIPLQYEGIQDSLRCISRKSPDSKTLLVYEGGFEGALPSMLGAPGICPIGHIGIGIIPVLLSSIDLKPLNSGFWPDSTPEGRARNPELTKIDRIRMAGSQKRFEEVMKEMGAKTSDVSIIDANYVYGDRFIQMCAPSIEFPRSDLPAGFRFAGGLPPGVRDPLASKPDWWDDISVNSNHKRIVAVSQGTMAVDAAQLIIPTIMACKDNQDIIVVAALGSKGAMLPEAVNVPSNARVADWIPYDEMLQYADVFITNGGYGAIQHGLGHGVPLIVAGTEADKPDNAMRVQWAGVGVNLHTQTPTPEIVNAAVLEVLDNRKYKEKAVEIQVEMQSYDPIGVIIESIEAVAEGN